jgi:hypothetical protein
MHIWRMVDESVEGGNNQPPNILRRATNVLWTPTFLLSFILHIDHISTFIKVKDRWPRPQAKQVPEGGVQGHDKAKPRHGLEARGHERSKSPRAHWPETGSCRKITMAPKRPEIRATNGKQKFTKTYFKKSISQKLFSCALGRFPPPLNHCPPLNRIITRKPSHDLANFEMNAISVEGAGAKSKIGEARFLVCGLAISLP